MIRSSAFLHGPFAPPLTQITYRSPFFYVIINGCSPTLLFLEGPTWFKDAISFRFFCRVGPSFSLSGGMVMDSTGRVLFEDLLPARVRDTFSSDFLLGRSTGHGESLASLFCAHESTSAITRLPVLCFLLYLASRAIYLGTSLMSLSAELQSSSPLPLSLSTSAEVLADMCPLIFSCPFSSLALSNWFVLPVFCPSPPCSLRVEFPRTGRLRSSFLFV